MSKSQERRIRVQQEAIRKHAKLGSGKRFTAVEKEAAASGARNPAAVAAAAGREKYGAQRMGQLAALGRKRNS